MKNSIFKIFLIIGIICFLNSCARNNVSDVNQSERFIEGKIIDNNGFEVYNAEVYLYGTDITTTTDEKGYFKLILPKGYKIPEIYDVKVIDTYGNGDTVFGFILDEKKFTTLVLDDSHRLTNRIFDPPQPFCGLPINQNLIKFKIVYDYIYDSPATLDESWFEGNGKPVPNATIQIQGTENIYRANENGEIWIEKNEIKYADFIVIEDEMGTQSQVYISEKILKNKVIPFIVLIHID